jgi:hypothetical protein
MDKSQNQVVKRINGFLIRIGGRQHSGWLPPGAAMPLPTPSREVLMDFEIQFDGAGYLLICCARDRSVYADTWHISLEDAESQANYSYGVAGDQWIVVGKT